MTFEEQLEAGIQYSVACLKQTDTEAKKEAMTQALRLLMPLVQDEPEQTSAATYIGVTAHHMALHFMDQKDMAPGGQNDGIVPRLFQLAAKYYTMVCDMRTGAGDLYPAIAMNGMAKLYETGVLTKGQPDDARAFSLRTEAAKAGLADAQLELAFMYEAGRGTPRSVVEAEKWVLSAIDSDRLSPTNYCCALKLYEQIVHEVARPNARTTSIGLCVDHVPLPAAKVA